MRHRRIIIKFGSGSVRTEGTASVPRPHSIPRSGILNFYRHRHLLTLEVQEFQAEIVNDADVYVVMFERRRGRERHVGEEERPTAVFTVRQRSDHFSHAAANSILLGNTGCIY